MVYVFDTPPRGIGWKGVFLADSVPTARNEITIADRGEVHMDAGTRTGHPAALKRGDPQGGSR